MARRKVQFRSDMRPDFRPNDEDLRYALRTLFGTREEMREMFCEWEAALVETIHRACERASMAPTSEKQVADTTPFTKTT